MSALLASVTDRAEAGLAVAGGADLIDLKQPAGGALGALPNKVVRDIVAMLHGRVPVSATTGDLPMDPERLGRAARAKAATGVDYVKVGLFAGGDWPAAIRALARVAAEGAPLIAVLFADQRPDIRVLRTLARAGFVGAMVDTADKAGGGLRSHWSDAEVAAFVRGCRAHGLLSGCAGSLRAADIAPLRAAGPDYLGFRGALCRGAQRVGRLDAGALALIRRTLDAATATLPAPGPFSDRPPA